MSIVQEKQNKSQSLFVILFFFFDNFENHYSVSLYVNINEFLNFSKKSLLFLNIFENLQFFSDL